MQTIGIILKEGGVMPSKQHAGDANFDVCANLLSPKEQAGLTILHAEDMPIAYIEPGATVKVPLGFSYEIPSGFVMELFSRSGHASRGIVIANAPAQLDAGYKGEAIALIHNQGKTAATIMHTERIAQMRIDTVLKQQVKQITATTESQRGENGIGSTGKI